MVPARSIRSIPKVASRKPGPVLPSGAHFQCVAETYRNDISSAAVGDR
jgi:hypothetical protein